MVFAAEAAVERGLLKGAHGDRTVLPKSCQACHRGMSISINGEEGPCLDCHGNLKRREQMIAEGYLSRTGSYDLKDVGFELEKQYSHPVLRSKGIHQRTELLPEDRANVARHSECVDCHNPHVVEKDRPFLGIPGRKIVNLITEIDQEYELCYKCHAESANLPSRSTDKAVEFKISNPSFHPVEGEGRQVTLISLKEPYAARKERPGDISTISCRDCHGSDDPDGPKGPHGSNYRGLLSTNYELEDGRSESEFAYALCYKCHERSSILGNESFLYHRQHIEGDRAKRQPGTSCFTCHDAHGSTVNPYLIRFNDDVVRSNADGKMEYKAQGVSTRHGSCSLNCHGVEHKDRKY